MKEVSTRTLTSVVHGESGVGKSWLGDTAEKPLLVLDAEGGSRFTPSYPKIYWSPYDPPPTYDGSWQTCVCIVRDFDTMQRAFQWLNAGAHHFRSVTLDSITEIQKRCLDNVSGINAPTQQDWGTLLRSMEMLVRQFRDLTMHPTTPLSTVTFIATTRPDSKNLMRPHLQGQLGLTLPYFVDVLGYLYTDLGMEGQLERKLLVQPFPGFAAKDRTGRLPSVIDNPDLTRIMEMIYGTAELAGTTG